MTVESNREYHRRYMQKWRAADPGNRPRGRPKTRSAEEAQAMHTAWWRKYRIRETPEHREHRLAMQRAYSSRHRLDMSESNALTEL